MSEKIIGIDFFVAPYVLDVDDDDGLEDIIVSPNWKEVSENYHVGWFYKNVGEVKDYVFEFQQSDWLVVQLEQE